MATKAPPNQPKFMVNTVLTRFALVSSTPAYSVTAMPVSRSTRPEDRTVKAVRVHTTMVSAKTSKMPHMPCLTGSRTLELECTITEEPRPASLENTPRFMPCSMASLMP